MSDDQERIAALTDNLARMAVLASETETFAAAIITEGMRHRFTRERLYEIRAERTLKIKNAGVAGLPIEREAEMLRQLIQDFEDMTERAIANGWQR